MVLQGATAGEEDDVIAAVYDREGARMTKPEGRAVYAAVLDTEARPIIELAADLILERSSRVREPTTVQRERALVMQRDRARRAVLNTFSTVTYLRPHARVV